MLIPTWARSFAPPDSRGGRPHMNWNKTNLRYSRARFLIQIGVPIKPKA